MKTVRISRTTKQLATAGRTQSATICRWTNASRRSRTRQTALRRAAYGLSTQTSARNSKRSANAADNATRSTSAWACRDPTISTRSSAANSESKSTPLSENNSSNRWAWTALTLRILNQMRRRMAPRRRALFCSSGAPNPTRLINPNLLLKTRLVILTKTKKKTHTLTFITEL